MAKKIVRGITDVKTIINQDFDTNNVNDLLSDGQYNYIHRKKGKNEEYHNLTDNIKTLSSDNTELLSVTNYNKTTNTALLSPKHDKQIEQLLESTRNTMSIHHGTNATAEKTTVDTNPEKVLEHENLITDYGISKNTTGNTTKLGIEYTLVNDGFDLNNLQNGLVRSRKFVNSPKEGLWWFYVSSFTEGQYTIQDAVTLVDDKNTTYRRVKQRGTWGAWREQVGDKSTIDGLLSQKEQLLESTRNTITINHGTNGTAEKTTVDTNPKKVLEHENLISDSEYITLEHQQGENATHIKTAALKEELNNLHETKQDVLTAGEGITIDGQTISASAPTSNIKFYYAAGWLFRAFKQVVTNGDYTFVTFTFDCKPQFTQRELDGNIKQDLEKFVRAGMTVSNGAISITNDGTTMKLIKSGASENVNLQVTFTFWFDTIGS